MTTPISPRADACRRFLLARLGGSSQSGAYSADCIHEVSSTDPLAVIENGGLTGRTSPHREADSVLNAGATSTDMNV